MLSKIKQAVKRLFKKEQQVSVNMYSQPHVLSFKMEDANMTHAQRALVDIDKLRVIELESTHDHILMFCPIDKIGVKEVLHQGDGKRIPREEVKLKNLTAPEVLDKRQGNLFRLRNVILDSNGVISLEATYGTEWELIKEQKRSTSIETEDVDN